MSTRKYIHHTQALCVSPGESFPGSRGRAGPTPHHARPPACPPASAALTSRDSRQYQQKACLQLLHIIWAHPSSRSMYTLHLGQRLMGALSSSGLKAELWGHVRQGPAHSPGAAPRPGGVGPPGAARAARG